MSDAAVKVLALDLGGTKLAAGIGHPDGRITHADSAATDAADGAQHVLTRAITLARGCLEAARREGDEVQAVGVSTMGYTRQDGVALAPNVPGWDALRIPETLAAAFPDAPVTIRNDVRVAAMAELAWGALRGVEHGIYLNLGTGIAAAIVTGGRVLEGAHGAAGEVGYSLFAPELETRMAADGATPFEEHYGGAGAARRLRSEGLADSVAELASLGERPGAGAFLEELWTGIARLAANLCIALDPSTLVVGGGYLRGDAAVLTRIGEIVARAVPFPPRVLGARFGADASLRGAAVAALQALAEPTEN